MAAPASIPDDVRQALAMAALDRRPPDPECSWLPLPVPAKQELELLRTQGATEFALREIRGWPCAFSSGGFFRLAQHEDEGEPAFISLVSDVRENGLDLVAWPTRDPKRLARRDGAAALLGEGSLSNPATFYRGRPVRIFRSPITWLANDRNGVVIVDPVGAALRLADVPGILAEDTEHARELGRLLAPHVSADRILASRAASKVA